MKKRRLKKWVVALIIGLIVFVVGIVILIKHINKINSIEYKLGTIGYSEEEIAVLKNNLSEEQLNNDILNMEYNDFIDDLVNERYFIYNYLDRYLKYHSLSKSSAKEIVRLVNCNRDRGYYENMEETDVSKDILMLVNKYYYLSEGYVPEDLVDISSKYAYAGNKIREVAYDDLVDLMNNAKKAGYNLVVNTSYRSYEDQKTIYNSRKIMYGQEYADTYAARAGNSEHQTGLTLDIVEYGSNVDFSESDAYKWLSANAYRYGFIERYKESYEDVTGYSAEAWHYRYVGKEVASEIYQNDITFEEYYSYYILNK